jgi:hypothetical protein
MSMQITARIGAPPDFIEAAYALLPTSPDSSALKKQKRTVWVSFPFRPAKWRASARVAARPDASSSRPGAAPASGS